MKLSTKIFLPIILISALLILLVGCFGIPSPGYTPGTGTITGIIAAPCGNTSGEPISENSDSPEFWCSYCLEDWYLQEGVKVILTSGEEEIATVFTNELGEYIFTDVPPGKNYVITAYHPDNNIPLVKDVALELIEGGSFDAKTTDLVSTSLGLVVDYVVYFAGWDPEDISLDEVIAAKPDFDGFPKFGKLIIEVRRVLENCEDVNTDDKLLYALYEAAGEISKLDIGGAPGFTPVLEAEEEVETTGGGTPPGSTTTTITGSKTAGYNVSDNSVTGLITVNNTGSIATTGLAIQDQLQKLVEGTGWENMGSAVDVDVTSKPNLNATESYGYSYALTGLTFEQGVTYRNKADITITNGNPVTVTVYDNVDGTIPNPFKYVKSGNIVIYWSLDDTNEGRLTFVDFVLDVPFSGSAGYNKDDLTAGKQRLIISLDPPYYFGEEPVISLTPAIIEEVSKMTNFPVGLKIGDDRVGTITMLSKNQEGTFYINIEGTETNLLDVNDLPITFTVDATGVKVTVQ